MSEAYSRLFVRFNKGIQRRLLQYELTSAGSLPLKVVYVSFNPAKQARDLARMDAHYQVASIQPIDLSPHAPCGEYRTFGKKRGYLNFVYDY